MDPSPDARRGLLRPFLIGSVGAALFAGMFALRLGGVAWFLHLGKNWTPTIDFARALFGPRVPVRYTEGHDGQFFWVVSRDPLLLHRSAAVHLLDRPTYRAQRIAYPLLAWPWRLLGQRALLWGLVVTNVVVVGFGTVETTRLARHLGAPDRAAIAFGLCPTVIVALIGDLGDGLAVLFVVVAIRFVLERRAVAAAAAFAVACLAKESSLLVVAGVLFAAPTTFAARTRMTVAATPLAAVGGWALYERWRLGWPETNFLEFDWPLRAYLRGWHYEWSHFREPVNGLMALALWIILFWTAARWLRRPTVMRAAALAPCIFVPIFSENVISISLNSLRAIGPTFTLLAVDLYAGMAARRRTPVSPSG